MSSDEEGSKLSESFKVGLAVFIKLVGQIVQICNAIFDDPDPLSIKALRAIEEIHNASADHGIQCHQRPLVLTSHLRPTRLFVGFPEGEHGIPIHTADLQ